MRTRLCYLALLILPVLAYWPVFTHEFGSPEDFLRLNAPEVLAADGAQKGILHGALQDLAFHSVSSVPLLAALRGLSLLLVVLCGVAIWQVTERAGWSEIDAAALAVAVMMLPAPQLYLAWAAAWPAALAALLSLAAFAATESELEVGGTRRLIGLLGGALLYFGAAMCYFPNATMGLVPLAALALARPLRVAHDLKKWFAIHLGVMAAGLIASGVLERLLMQGAGVVDRTQILGRLESLVTFALPAGWAVFVVGEHGSARTLAAVIGGILILALIAVARRDARLEPRAAAPWGLALGVTTAVFGVVAVFAPNWHGGYRSLWPLGGIVVVGLVCAVRGVGEQPAKKSLWHYAALGGLVAVGVLAAGAQVLSLLVSPLEREWEALNGAVVRAKIVGEVKVQLRLPPDGTTDAGIPEARFDARVAQSSAAAVQMFNAALDDRFAAGLPKGTKVHVDVLTGAAPAPDALVFELKKY
ncbi:hypothetical protein [Oleiharenicola sp. Vm1]|uniref:hypothetical protein n=1 Tax=Oleiharenicola sp. Vm1 TaxID=3398393 RepID=UPI0039F456C9